MRKHMYGVLEGLFGRAVRSREGCDWWVISRPGKRPVHICLDSPSEDVAHVLIFDPDPVNVEYIIDVSARTDSEADAIIRRLAPLVPMSNEAASIRGGED